jgi:prepilin-type N-terminal cleavage/methylation domain-containing protein
MYGRPYMKEPVMKRIYNPIAPRSKGFSLLEVLVSMTIVGIIAALIFSTQTSTWKKSTSGNRAIVAGNMIQNTIDSIRVTISQNQDIFFPPINGTITSNGVLLNWVISNAYRATPDAGNLPNVRKCDFVASWSASKGDTLKVTTYLAKMF